VFAVAVALVSVLSHACLVLTIDLADEAGVSHHALGIVVVAAGAQVPDALASVAVAKRGEGPAAIANAVGAQVLNVLVGLGLPFALGAYARGSSVPIDPATKESVPAVLSSLALFLVLCFGGLREPRAWFARMRRRRRRRHAGDDRAWADDAVEADKGEGEGEGESDAESDADELGTAGERTAMLARNGPGAARSLERTLSVGLDAADAVVLVAAYVAALGWVGVTTNAANPAAAHARVSGA